MHRTKYSLYLLAILFSLCAYGEERGSSAPYISGDSFRVWSDFTYDELGRNMDPRQVRDGNTIFVKTDYLDEFFSKVHPLIPCRYILITHNSDYHVPKNHARMLDDEKLIAWFGQSVEDCNHPKMHRIPIGIANRCWTHGNINLFAEMQRYMGKAPRDVMLYMNFTVDTFFSERSQVAKLFKKQPYCYAAKPKSFPAYLDDLLHTKFVLSPRGNSLDCHRTWEALLLGAIPIVRTSSLDPLYEGLPVVIIKSWHEATLPFLKEKYKEIQGKNYNTEKLYIDYWYRLIDSFRPCAEKD